MDPEKLASIGVEETLRPTKRSKAEYRSTSSRHPPHLRGKQIGMFYAKRNRERRLAEGRSSNSKRLPKSKRPLGRILLSETKKQEIQKVLDDTANSFESASEENIKFHYQFQKVVSGTMQDKLTSEVGINRDRSTDMELYTDFINLKKTLRYQTMQKVRETLPSYQKRDEILKQINNNQVVVISGETGCGKTTQVAQFILDDFLEKKEGSMCHILCTQPRRISAIMVAERVAQERAEKLGHSVGYWIRIEHQKPRSRGSIIYCTTGMVLKHMENDPNLTNVSHVILDEVHERDTSSDLLITLLKQVTSKRNDLKLILMSATLNADMFSKYYDACPHINIPGRTFSVQKFYLEDVLQRTGFMFDPFERPRRVKHEPEYEQLLQTHIRELEANKLYSPRVCKQLRNPLINDINLDLILLLLIDICEKETDPGAILVFLTGYQEISKLIQIMSTSGKFPSSHFLILPLYSIMPTMNQRQVFERPPPGVRKIIVATNIAETSITIDDVVFVIDCGKIKMSNYDVESNTSTLQPEWVSLANASQRRGRAGRVQPGVCFHLFTKAREMVLPQYQEPEILRKRLENTILTIKILQLGDATSFLNQLLNSPCKETITTSLELLKRLDALDQDEKLTPLGYHLARLPIAPQFGKMLLLGAIFNCIEPVLSIAASLDYKDAFQMPIGKERLADQKRLELANGCKSDHLLFYQALSQYEERESHEASRFCWEYFLSRLTLNQLSDMKKQLMGYLYDLDFVNTKDPTDIACNANSQNMSLVKAIICAGLYPNVATIRHLKMGNKAYVIEGSQHAAIHPKSVLYREVSLESRLIVFYLIQRSSVNFIHDATIIHPLPLIFFGDNYKFNIDENHSTVSIGSDRLLFNCSKSTNAIIKELRNRLNLILEKKVSNPGFVSWQENNPEIPVLRAVVEIITSEDIGEMDIEAYDDYN